VVTLVRERVSYSAGQRIPLSFKSPTAHFFDPETGKRLD
jgi:hypothetical protein